VRAAPQPHVRLVREELHRLALVLLLLATAAAGGRAARATVLRRGEGEGPRERSSLGDGYGWAPRRGGVGNFKAMGNWEHATCTLAGGAGQGPAVGVSQPARPAVTGLWGPRS
jgi:hypothetical protein